MLIDPKANLADTLTNAEIFIGLAVRSQKRDERDAFERIAALYLNSPRSLRSCSTGRRDRQS
jgi:hypothetical protein